MNNIQALVLDIDGVIVGDRKILGPKRITDTVIKRLRSINQKIPVVLCTARGSFGFTNVLEHLQLSNFHIGDGGAVLLDPLTQEISSIHTFERNTVIEICKKLIEQDLYTEIYTPFQYHIFRDQLSGITADHTRILSVEPQIMNSIEEIPQQDIVKIMPVVYTSKEADIVNKIFEQFEDITDLHWASPHPGYDYGFAFALPPGVSKKNGLLESAELLKIDPANILAVGDSWSDWHFMEECGYVGAMSNAHQELLDAVNARDTNGVIGNTVTHDGLIEILDYFEL